MSGGWLVLVLVAVSAVYVVVAHRQMRARATREARQAIEGHALQRQEDDATYLGLTSKGLAQSSGQGCLVLSDQVLFYAQWEPRRRVRIRHDQLVEALVSEQHERPTGGRPMLTVVFEDETGEEDRATWLVEDPRSWVDLLDVHIERSAAG